MELLPKTAAKIKTIELQNKNKPISAKPEAPKFLDINAEDKSISNAMITEVTKVCDILERLLIKNT